MQNNEDGVEALGLEPKEVRLREPTPIWTDLYRDEERSIRAALGSLLAGIEHFGSTSIPEIKAKPILDILVGIPRFEDSPRCVAPLEAIGYEYVPEAGIPHDCTFGKGTPARTHLLHVVEYGGPNWMQALLFRDGLRRDPSLAQKYEALKIVLAEQYAHSRADYTAAKTDFVHRVIGWKE